MDTKSRTDDSMLLCEDSLYLGIYSGKLEWIQKELLVVLLQLLLAIRKFVWLFSVRLF